MKEDEREAIRHVLKALLLDGDQWFRAKRSTWSDGQFAALNARQLDSYLRRNTSSAFEPRRAIRVRPPDQDREVRLSALWCRWDFGAKRCDCWFHLGLWLRSGSFMAFRFEPPEQGDNHNYYHSQPCRSMGWEGSAVHGAMAVPERNPTWPLPACTSLDLLLCLAVSIHGMRGLTRLKRRIDNQGKAPRNQLLAAAFEKMAKVQAPAL